MAPERMNVSTFRTHLQIYKSLVSAAKDPTSKPVLLGDIKPVPQTPVPEPIENVPCSGLLVAPPAPEAGYEQLRRDTCSTLKPYHPSTLLGTGRYIGLFLTFQPGLFLAFFQNTGRIV